MRLVRKPEIQSSIPDILRRFQIRFPLLEKNYDGQSCARVN